MYREMYVVSAVALSAVLMSGTAGASDARTVERRVAAAATGLVEISNVSGSVEVRGTDKAEVFVRGALGRDVERLDVLAESGRTRVLVVLPRKSNVRRGSADLEVFVPRGSSLKIATTSADVTSSGVNGAQEIGTVSGEVTAEIGNTEIEVKTVSGDVDLRGNGKPADVTVSTVSGSLSLDRAGGALEVVTVSGDLEVTMADTRELRVRSTSGDATVHCKLLRDARVSMETVSGDFSLRAPSQAGFSTDIESFSGDIGGCMKSSVQRASKYGPGTRLETKVGEGSARVRMKSLSGNIDVCDR
jgi:DUF4097 and DUF4098 domain-containing protein YvlB